MEQNASFWGHGSDGPSLVEATTMHTPSRPHLTSAPLMATSTIGHNFTSGGNLTELVVNTSAQAGIWSSGQGTVATTLLLTEGNDTGNVTDLVWGGAVSPSATPGVRFIAPTRGPGIDWTSNAMTAILVVATAGVLIACVFLAAGFMHCFRKCRRHVNPPGSEITNAYGSGENYAVPYSSSERRLLGYTRTALDSPTGSGSGSWGRQPSKPRPQVHKHLPYCSSLTRVAPYDAHPRPVQYRHTPQADIVRTVAASRRPRPKSKGGWRSLPDGVPSSAPIRLSTPSPDYENMRSISQDFPKPVPPNLQHNSPKDVDLCALQNAANGMQENWGSGGKTRTPGDGSSKATKSEPVKFHLPPRLPHQGSASIELQSLHIGFGGNPNSENFQSNC